MNTNNTHRRLRLENQRIHPARTSKFAGCPETLRRFEDNRRCPRSARGNERSQATIALLGLIAISLAIAVGLGLIGDAMVHRVRAHGAADAIALAAAIDVDTAHELAARYARADLHAEIAPGYALVTSGPSQAAAWAATTESAAPAPVMVAVVARAEQLLGRELASARITAVQLDLDTVDGADFSAVAGEFGVCRVVSERSGDRWIFRPC